MHQSVRDFIPRVLTAENVAGRRVLEVGAYDVNGTVRPYVESLQPDEYVATDRRKGPGVDRVIPASQLLTAFPPDAFDVVLCLETLEHILHWRVALFTMLQVLKTGGLLMLTSRSEGFPHHDHPEDHWRWDWREWGWLSTYGAVKELIEDPQHPGFFLVFRKLTPVPLHGLDEIRATAAPRS